MAQTWFRWLLELIVSFVHLVTFNKMLPSTSEPTNPDEFTVNVKFSKDLTLPVKIQPGMTVHEVKEHLAETLNIPMNELRIIFSGREMQDQVMLEDFDVGDQTILHAVKRPPEGATAINIPELQVETACPLSDAIVKLQLTDQDRNAIEGSIDVRTVHFFVFCNSQCKRVCPGKLRVQCSTCKQGTLLLLQDPECWEDVLERGRIKGLCQNESCDGKEAEFYFKCAAHKPNTETAAPLENVKNNYQDVPCIACQEVSQIVVVFTCESSHVICLECFQRYCMSRLDERKFVHTDQYGYSLKCPVNCANSFIKESHLFRILGEEQYARYQRFATEDFIISVGGVFCPRPGCGAGFPLDETMSKCTQITCPRIDGHGCGFVFCRSCLQGAHMGPCGEEDLAEKSLTLAMQREGVSGGTIFQVDENQATVSRWDRSTRITIKGTTKPCPKCRTATERSGGCMHMECARCDFSWCWICQREWTRSCQGAHWFG